MNTKQKAVVAYFVIFLVGLITGLLIKDQVIPGTDTGQIEISERERGERPGWMNRQRGERPERAVVRRNLSRQLDLEGDQAEAFMERLSEYHTEIRGIIRELREDEREAVAEKYKAFREELAELLNDEQLKKLDGIAHPDSIRSAGAQRMRSSGRPGL